MVPCDYCNITKEDENGKCVIISVLFTFYFFEEEVKYICVGNLHNPTNKIFLQFWYMVTKKEGKYFYSYLFQNWIFYAYLYMICWNSERTRSRSSL